MKTGTITSGEGAELCYFERGDLHGSPVFWLHGTPGSRLSQPVEDNALNALGVRVITYDRPGYGLSTRRPGRQVVDAAADVALIADHLKIDTFMLVGRSGGAPHALAVTARLPERVSLVRSVAGVAPYQCPDLDWFAGMDPSNIREFHVALQGEAELTEELTQNAQDMLRQLENGTEQFLADFDLPDADRDARNEPLFEETTRAAIREALRNGIGGWIDDDLAIMRPWGFEVEEIAVPTQIQYGLSDNVVPPTHSMWLADHIPHASRIPDAGVGHLTSPGQELRMLREMIHRT